MKKNLFIFSFIILNQFVFSQKTAKDSAYNKLYYDIAVNLSTKNPKRALHLSDSLYKDALSERKKIKALMLSADILVKQDKLAEGIKYALNALVVAKKSADFDFQTRIYGFLSTQCRTIGFYQKGEFYLKEGIAMSSELDTNKKLQYLAMANHELAEYALIREEFNKALEYIEKSVDYYQTLDNSPYKNFVLANTQQLKGRCYIGLNRRMLALNQFKNARDNIEKSKAENSIFSALILQGMGETYMLLKEKDSAQAYLTKALQLSEPVTNVFLKEKVYGSLSKYYQDQGKTDIAVIYLTKYNQTVRTARNQNKQRIDTVMNYLQENSSSESSNNWILDLGIGILLISGGVGVYLYRNKRDIHTTTEAGTEPAVRKSVPVELSPIMIEKFTQKLRLFEYEERFLDKTLSYSMLATALETNTKYLSYFLKDNLQTDYHTYINTLRIQFITNELKTNPEVRKYTLAHLADLSGYKSYSAFAVNFKRIMKQSPSAYIQNLK